MSDEPSDIKLAASLVCSFLKGQRQQEHDGVVVHFDKGVVAFARRVGEKATPRLFVQPISTNSLAKDLCRAIGLGRNPNATGHFSELTAHPSKEWGFSLSHISAERLAKTSAAKRKLRSHGVQALADRDRNALDLECFSNQHILRVPVSFLASPLLVCYFDYEANDRNPLIEPVLKEIIFNRIVSPLSSLLATHIVLQLSQLAREIVFAEIRDVRTAQEQLVHEAAGLLWATSARFDSSSIVKDEAPLASFPEGFMLSGRQIDAGIQRWEIKLPAFKTFTGEKVGKSTAIPGARLLRERIEAHVADLLHLLNRAAQWWEQGRAVATNRMVGEIEKDLRELLTNTEAARKSALRVESVLTPSKEDFLKHYDELRGLFEEDQKRWYGTKRQNGKTKCTKVFMKEADCNKKGFKPSAIETIHSPENVAAAKWNRHYKAFLGIYGRAEEINLFRQLSSVSVQKHQDGTARKLFRVLKLMVQRPHASPDKLFGVQMAISCATAWHGQPRKEVVYETDAAHKRCLLTGSNGKKALRLGEVLKIDEGLLSDRDSNAYELSSAGTCTQLLGTLMRLIKLELTQHDEEENVYAQKVTIRHIKSWLEVAVECSGCFATPKEDLSVSNTSSMRGLRALVENLCRATGQDQPHFVNKTDDKSFRATKKRFVIGSSKRGKKTVWFMRFPRFLRRASRGTDHRRTTD